MAHQTDQETSSLPTLVLAIIIFAISAALHTTLHAFWTLNPSQYTSASTFLVLINQLGIVDLTAGIFSSLCKTCAITSLVCGLSEWAASRDKDGKNVPNILLKARNFLK